MEVFPGICLLSRWRLLGLPVDFAIRLGPGLIPIVLNVLSLTMYYHLYLKQDICQWFYVYKYF